MTVLNGNNMRSKQKNVYDIINKAHIIQSKRLSL